MDIKLNGSNITRLIMFSFFVAVAFISTLSSFSGGIGSGFSYSSRAASNNTTDPDLKVAFIGDQDLTSNSKAVLTLIKNEGAAMVLHQGDFDYANNPQSWDDQINSILGPSFPYFASVGNHDDAQWSGYQQKLTSRLSKIAGANCTGEYGVNAKCTYRGLSFVLSGAGTRGSGWDTFIKSSFSSDPSIWKVCTWHKNMAAMQVGSKGDEAGWPVYEACRQMGALIMTGHEHSYHRTKTMTNIQSQIIDPTCSDPSQECVSPGKTFVVVSGLGGRDMRNQDKCLPATYPYGCNGLWSKIYTSNQTNGAQKFGALFIIFNYQGSPTKAHAYFKNTNGEIIDQFDIGSGNGVINNGNPTPTPTTGQSTPVPTISSGSCSTKSQGDADCNGSINLADFEIFRKEFTGILASRNADFDSNGSVGISDFELWRRTSYGSGNVPTSTPGGGNPTSTPTLSSPTATPIVPTGGASNAGSMWISPAEIAKLPMSGTAWTNLKSAADGNLGSPNISDQDNGHDVLTMASALVYARTGNSAYRAKAASAIMSAIGTEKGGRVLAEARNLPGYVIAADLINLKAYDSGKDAQFRTWLMTVRGEQMTECDNLILCQNRRPNNWGLMAAAARVSIDIYLNDKSDLDKAANVFKGWMGDRAAYSSFEWGDLSWQCNSSTPVGVNPACTKNGHSLDGALPDDMRRGGSFTWPPGATNYPWEALQGAAVTAELLHRQGYDSYNWSNQALKRATQFVFSINFKPTDDAFVTWIINKAYGTTFSTVTPLPLGKNIGWTDWTHGPGR